MYITDEADYPEQYASIEQDYVEAVKTFVATQTFITGKSRETLTKVMGVYASLIEESIDTPASEVTAKVTAEGSTGVAAFESGLGAGSVASVNAVCGVFAGVVAGVLAVISLL
jgi:hypothetical protein